MNTEERLSRIEAKLAEPGDTIGPTAKENCLFCITWGNNLIYNDWIVDHSPPHESMKLKLGNRKADKFDHNYILSIGICRRALELMGTRTCDHTITPFMSEYVQGVQDIIGYLNTRGNHNKTIELLSDFDYVQERLDYLNDPKFNLYHYGPDETAKEMADFDNRCFSIIKSVGSDFIKSMKEEDYHI